MRRTQQFQARAQPLPGRHPYTNRRPMAVTGPFDRARLIEFLTRRHPHIAELRWRDDVMTGHVEVDGRPIADPEHIVRAGNQVAHVLPDCVEPTVSVRVRVLFEDDSFVVLHKPAPLPVHPCGRYHLHSLTWLWARCFDGQQLRPVHRLDTDTAGLLLLAKSSSAARALSDQFAARTVHKAYLALVEGEPPGRVVELNYPVSSTSQGRGRRSVDATGRSAQTRVELLATASGRSLLAVHPRSGRTNQIRVHLSTWGHPIVGDVTYAGDEPLISGTALCLQAWRLGFCHPTTGDAMTFEDRVEPWAAPFTDDHPSEDD
ncbi:MAG: RluA family pseudouridine synthase [Myxococcales bacterium FL481]|nr:MAG: RluA family pseudouridine synthase [Myxococcales bacterium FL481]